MKTAFGTILERRELPKREGEQPCEIILVHRDTNPHHPYVTWQRNVPEKGGDGGRYWGHYFKTLAEAVADFNTRGH